MDKNLEFLLSEYKDRMQFLTAGLAQGNIPTMEEYRYICGQLRGLEAACLIIVELKNRLDNSDD
jgi:hypothetical protein